MTLRNKSSGVHRPLARKKKARASANRKDPPPKAAATRTYHTAKYQTQRDQKLPPSDAAIRIPRDQDTVDVRFKDKAVHLTNLRKVFWPELGITKGDLIQFYIDVAAILIPHLAQRAMVMKRYPHGITGEFFFHETRAVASARMDRDLLH